MLSKPQHLTFCFLFDFTKNIKQGCADSFEENFSFSAEVVYTYDESQENGKRKRKYKSNGRNSENFNLNEVVTYKLKVRHYVNHSTSLFPFSVLPKISSSGFRFYQKYQAAGNNYRRRIPAPRQPSTVALSQILDCTSPI